MKRQLDITLNRTELLYMLTGELLQSLNEEGFFQNNLFLTLNDCVTQKDLLRYKLSLKISSNSIYADAKSSYCDTPMNSEFDVIFRLKSPGNFLTIKSKILHASLRPNVDLDTLPRGHSAICLIDFPTGIPEMAQKFKFTNAQDSQRPETLYLTTLRAIKIILDRLGK